MRLRGRPPTERAMLYWALVFLVIAVIAGLLGFGGVASTAAGIAQVLFFVFLVVVVIALIIGLVGGPPRPRVLIRAGGRPPPRIRSGGSLHCCADGPGLSRPISFSGFPA